MPLWLDDAVPPVLPHPLLELKRLEITCVEMSMYDSLAEILVTIIECTTRNEELVRNNEDELK